MNIDTTMIMCYSENIDTFNSIKLCKTAKYHSQDCKLQQILIFFKNLKNFAIETRIN